MKKVILTLNLIFFVSYVSFSQNILDTSLSEITQDLAIKINKKGIKRIVVLYVTDIAKTQTSTGKYMADMISVTLVNDSANFEVFDRDNLSNILEAKQLIKEGYIDTDEAKQIGAILAVDAIIVGNYTVLSRNLKLTLKALNVTNGFVIAASTTDIIVNDELAALLGVSFNDGQNMTSKGFNNRPLNSNESYNNPETVNKDCEEKNTGDYCFINNTQKTVYVTLFRPGQGNNGEIVISPGESQCYYNISAQSYKYVFASKRWSWYMSDADKTGQVLVEKCKSKTYVIK